MKHLNSIDILSIVSITSIIPTNSNYREIINKIEKIKNIISIEYSIDNMQYNCNSKLTISFMFSNYKTIMKNIEKIFSEYTQKEKIKMDKE